MTPAEELRTAAKTLREAIKNATPGPWQANDDFGVVALRTTWPHGFDDAYEWVIDDGVLENGGDAAWIGLIHPGLAEPLGAWLEAEADGWDAVETIKAEMGPKGVKVSLPWSTHEQALKVARAINGGAR